MRTGVSGIGFVIAGVLSVMTAAAPAPAATLLVSAEEAQMPPARAAIAADRRGISRGPKINLVAQEEQYHSPMHLKLKFESFGGSTINPESVKVTYLKASNVDLTPRVKPFVQTTGIEIPDAELPPGDHMLRVDVNDSDGRAGSAIVSVKVLP